MDSHDVDPKMFPKYTPALLASMRLEARRFVQEFLRSEPVQQMLSARFTFVDSALATHYGLTRSGGAATDFVRVDTSSTNRRRTADAGRVSHLDVDAQPNIAGQKGQLHLHPPAVRVHPATAAGRADAPRGHDGRTLRERLEAHRSKPECMGCHVVMDPLGFGLENYDGIGVYRTMDGTAPVDATGTLPDGKTMFNGAVELAAALSGDASFSACLTNKFMTFAVGRLLNQRDDGAWVNYLANRAMSAGGSLKRSSAP